jgi:hypothetical protein
VKGLLSLPTILYFGRLIYVVVMIKVGLGG